MRLAGIPVLDRDALELARLLRDGGLDGCAAVLEQAYDQQRAVVALEG